MAEHFTLKNNLVFVLAEAAGGVYNSDQLRTLCEVADNESAFLKITEDQRIGFMLDPNKLPEIQSHVRKSGIILRSYKAAGVPSPRACLGELCTFSQQPSLGDALELTTHLLKSFPSPKRHSTIGINGCSRACLGTSTEDIHVVAEDSGYKISIGGKGSEIPQQAQLLVENVPRNELPVVLEKLLAVFYQESSEDERIHNVIDRIGLTPFFKCLPENLMPAMHDHDDNNEAISAMEEFVDSSDESIEEGFSAVDSDLNNIEPQENVSDVSGLVETDEALILDGLIEQSAMEIDDSTVFETADVHSIEDEPDLNEPIVDIEPGTSLGDFEETAELFEASTNDATSEEGMPETDLLEDAEFEDGTLDDVSRIRDAIRTELSMTTSDSDKLTEKPIDLLDEISSNELDTFDDEPEIEQSFDSMTDAVSLEEEVHYHQTEAGTHEFSSEEPEMNSAQAENYGLQTEADEFDAPSAKRRDSKVTSNYQLGTEILAADVPKNVSGRLSIRFLDQQLAVELPSGMCFELPMDAVQEGSQFSMELPDGELTMERHGATLMVKLGLLQMKFPIPTSSARRVA